MYSTMLRPLSLLPEASAGPALCRSFAAQTFMNLIMLVDSRTQCIQQRRKVLMNHIHIPLAPYHKT